MMFFRYVKTLFFLPLIFVIFSTHAALVDYFKKMDNKSDNHKMRNIDFIYMINLEARPEKYERSKKQLDPYGIYPYRFSAVNGWDLSLEDINDIGLKFKNDMEGNFMATSYHLDEGGQPSHELIKNKGQAYFCHCMARGTIGCLLSHLSVLQDAYDSGYETIWVMEDDIEVLKNPHIISDLIDKLDSYVGKKNWDIFFTDRDIKSTTGEYVPCYGAARRPNFRPKYPAKFRIRREISPDFRRIGARFGTTSMIIRRSGMKKVLDFVKEYEVFLPIDMDYHLHPNVKFFTVLEDVVSNFPGAPSDNGTIPPSLK